MLELRNKPGNSCSQAGNQLHKFSCSEPVNTVSVVWATSFLLIWSHLSLRWTQTSDRHSTAPKKTFTAFYLFFFLSNWQHAELEAPFNKWSTKPQSFGSRSLKEGPKALFWNSFFSVQCSPWTSTRRGSSCLVSFSYFLALKMKMISYKDFFQMRVFD